MRAATRWAVPVAVVAVIAGAVSVRMATADATPTLPDRTPAQVLALAAGSDVAALSGTVTSTVDLGLPALPSGSRPGGAGDAAADLVRDLLGGTTTARVAHDGPTKARVQVLDELAETDVVRNGAEVWTYVSRTNTVTHVTLPEHDRSVPTPTPTVPTPQQLAQRVLAAVDPTTAVTLDPPTRVAGRDAYVLRLTPRTDQTLVAAASVAVDAQTGLPLQVRIDARGTSGHAVDVGFTELSLQAPAASTFDFTPPPGATVHEVSPHPDGLGSHLRADDEAASERPRTFGSGWATVVELPPAALAGLDADAGGMSELLARMTRPVDGGQLLHTTLVNLFISADGRAYVGAVPLPVLQDAARQAAASAR